MDNVFWWIGAFVTTVLAVALIPAVLAACAFAWLGFLVWWDEQR